MAIKIIGNGGSGFGSLSLGGGVVRRKTPFSHLTVIGQAGDEARIAISDIYPKFDQVFQGITVQVTGASPIQIYTTLAPSEVALNPDQDGDGHWVTDTTATPGAIISLKNMCTAIRLPFVADGIVYIVGV